MTRNIICEGWENCLDLEGMNGVVQLQSGAKDLRIVSQIVIIWLCLSLCSCYLPQEHTLFDDPWGVRHFDKPETFDSGSSALGCSQPDGGYWTNERSFNQKLNHFDDFDSTTFVQKYFYNSYFDSGKGPIFLYIDGENNRTSFGGPVCLGLTYELGKRYNGLLFALEHRFYGNSDPSNRGGGKAFEHLSIHQALHDILSFIEGMQREYSIDPSRSWITVGGSYPGTLAAYARQAFPKIIIAAYAESAPMLKTTQWTNEYEQMQGVMNKLGRKRCMENHLAGLAAFASDAAVLNSTNIQHIRTKLNVCAEVDLSDRIEIDNIAYYVIGQPGNMLQYNDTSDLAAFCSHFESSACDSDPLACLGSYIQSEFAWTRKGSDPCIVPSANVTFDVGAKPYWQYTQKAWLWQQCTQVGYFRVFHGRTDIPSQAFYKKACSKAYLDHPVFPNTRVTNMIFGDWDMEISDIIWTNGGNDHWTSLSVRTPNSGGQVAHVVPNAGHTPLLTYVPGVNKPQIEEGVEIVTAFFDRILKAPCVMDVTCASKSGSCSKGRCVCQEGYTGPSCNTTVTDCENKCGINGACTVTGACACMNNAIGAQCDIIGVNPLFVPLSPKTASASASSGIADNLS